MCTWVHNMLVNCVHQSIWVYMHLYVMWMYWKPTCVCMAEYVIFMYMYVYLGSNPRCMSWCIANRIYQFYLVSKLKRLCTAHPNKFMVNTICNNSEVCNIIIFFLFQQLISIALLIVHVVIPNGTVSAKIAPRLKCYKNASRLNRYNFPTDNAIDFLFSTLHTTPFHYDVLNIGSR